MYDIEKIRADFPILDREVNGKPLIYLDNGASAQKPQAVIEAVTKGYSEEYANVHRGLHYMSNAATDAYEAAREKVRKFLNAPSVDNIIFTKSSTEAINTVAYVHGMWRQFQRLKGRFKLHLIVFKSQLCILIRFITDMSH